jgi:hypothetical protein
VDRRRDRRRDGRLRARYRPGSSARRGCPSISATPSWSASRWASR